MTTRFLSRAVSLSAVLVTAAHASAMSLQPHDVVAVDSFGAVLRVEKTTGNVSILAKDGNLVRPYGVLIDAHGDLIVSDTGSLAVIRIDHVTGKQTVLASGPKLGVPYGIALDRNGDILVANAQAIVRVNRRGVTIVASGGYLVAPLGVAVAGNGDIYVADAGAHGVIKIDNKTKAQSVVCTNGFVNPCGIAIDAAGNLLVTDTGASALISLNSQTGCDHAEAWVQGFVTPVGVTVDDTGKIVVGDPDAADLSGAVSKLDPATDTLTPVYTGSGDYVNPRGVAVVPGR